MTDDRVYPDESSLQRHEMARAAAVLYGAGGLLTLGSLLLPDRLLERPVVLVVVGAVAVATSLALLGMGSRLAPGLYQVLAGLGTALVSVAVWAAGPANAAGGYASFYVWVALYAFYFFGRGHAVGHLVGVGTGYAVALAALGWPAGALGWWFLATGTAGAAGGVVASLVGRVRVLARVDVVTGLANRRAWEESLPREIARAERTGAPLAVGVIDLDGFKRVNDTAGHHAGDRVLKRAAANWTAELRDSDLLARYGGDEFALVLPGCDAGELDEVLARLRASCPDDLGFSAGAAVWAPGEAPAELVHRADQALYAAKAAGRSCDVTAAPPPRVG